MKPILYGSIAAWWNDLPATINMITGLGFIFSSQSAWSKIVRWALMPVLKRLFRATNSYVIFQNKQDYDELCDADVVARARAAVIRGSGVDIERFFPRPEPDGQPVVLMASRMLWSKGVGDFVEAAKLLKNRRSLRCVLVGILDKENPDGVPEETLLEWDRQGIIEWWGERKDMDNVINNSHVVVLPTYYGEGLPKILLEAAACGRPLVATAVRGCLEIVRPEKNGFLVPPKDPPALAHAIEMLVGDPSLRALFGNQGREIVVQEFSSAKIVEETLAVYKNLLDRPSTVNSQPFLV
ncbi:MAG: glycosyltransferase family 4 protein [Elusimicrobia bacterium]|nr:glycosyltransferase family 4 protein [Elusimicrobiota bacterium]